MAKIFVTGAAGFIGSHTADGLLGEGHTVVGVDNFRTGKKENLAAALRSSAFVLHVQDITDPGVLAALVARLGELGQGRIGWLRSDSTEDLPTGCR